jgi:hypothetical protein
MPGLSTDITGNGRVDADQAKSLIRAAIPAACAGCAAPLGPHNITGLCAECKLIARNDRLSGQPADTAAPVTYDQARTNLAAILGARFLSHTDPTKGNAE